MPEDKLYHLTIGLLIYIVLKYFKVKDKYSLTFILFISIGKEFADIVIPGRRVEILDIVASFLPPLVFSFIIKILCHRSSE